MSKTRWNQKEKRKEGVQGTKRAEESKEKEKPRPCISKKWY
jgi:hypothetical protein